MAKYSENLALSQIAYVNFTERETGKTIGQLLSNPESSLNKWLNDSKSGNSVCGSGNDTYIFGKRDGIDTICDYDSTSGNTDTIIFGENLLNLIFAQKGNELVISINGTTDSLTVSNWYRGSSYQIEELETSNGSVLSGTQVGQLIQAMATFTKDEGISWSDVIQEKPEEVRDVLSQFWVSQQQ